MWTDTIAIILDTNMVIPGKNKIYDFSKLYLKDYEKTLQSIKYSDVEDHVKIFFPRIVFLELLSHHKRELTEEIYKWKKHSKRFENIGEIEIEGFNEFNVDETCASIEKFYEKELNIIEIPEDRNKLFSDILKCSIEKIPPFEVDKSDKGFKDTILFFSIIEFANKNRGFEKYILFSKDKIFKNEEEYFKDLFKRETNKNLEIINDKDMITLINEEFNLFKELKEYLKDEFFECMEDYYAKKYSMEIGSHSFEIIEFELMEDDTHIFKISENEFEVILYPIFYINNYCEERDGPCIGKKRCSLYCLSDFCSKTEMQEDVFSFKLEEGEWKTELISRLNSFD